MAMTMRERIALALLETTCRHFGDPIPENPDHTLNLVLADAVLTELETPTEAMAFEMQRCIGPYLSVPECEVDLKAAIRAAREGK
jgi:hypothetical protein